MPAGLLSRRARRAAALPSLVLAALPLLAYPSAGSAGSSAASCEPDEVSVVVDFNELGGATSVQCLAEGGTAARLFDEAGFPLTYSAVPGMPGFVCAVDGRPKAGTCTSGDSYWSLWWSAGPEDWAYATLGVTQLEIDRGGYLGFAWHQGDGDAQPPDVAVSTAAPGRPGPPDQAYAATVEVTEDEGVPAWPIVGGALLVLGAAVAVPLLRRRSR